MGDKLRGQLTESMFYVLMAFLQEERCGTDVAAYVEQRTHGRLRLGPGTLYTLLGKFQEERHIEDTKGEGRRHTYRLTDKGRAPYLDELERLRACVRDGEEALQ